MMCFIVPNKNTNTNSYTTETQTEKRAKDSFSNILRALQVRAAAGLKKKRKIVHFA